MPNPRQGRWLDARRADLLPVPYFHVVFTLPHALTALAQGNPRRLYALLFQTVAETLTTFGRDPRHLGGALGVTAIRHTWGQNLSQHLHVHCLGTGGALARDGSRWIPAPPGFLFPVRALAKVFRAKSLAALRYAFAAGQLRFAGATAPLAAPAAFTAWLAQLRQQAWVVYAKPPWAGPVQVLEYLGRYTHRVALSHERLVRHADGLIHFRWKDYAHGDHLKVMAPVALIDETVPAPRHYAAALPRGSARFSSVLMPPPPTSASCTPPRLGIGSGTPPSLRRLTPASIPLRCREPSSNRLPLRVRTA
jgi:hypothetical protein